MYIDKDGTDCTEGHKGGPPVYDKHHNDTEQGTNQA